MGMEKILMTMLAVGFIAIDAVEWKKLRTIQDRARASCILVIPAK